MARRPQMVRFKCGHEGCPEIVRYEADNRAHAIDLDKRYGGGRWRCVRHSQPGQVLAADNPKLVHEVAVNPINGHLYWGTGSGFAHGPGFRAFAEDFPAGTVLRVTAEIITPSKDTP